MSMKENSGRITGNANTQMTLERVLAWGRDEIIYRDYYMAQKSGGDTEAILAREDITEEEIAWLKYPEKIDPKKTENDFFSLGRNVQVVKHPRYFPLFFHDHTFFEMIYVLRGSCREFTGSSRETAVETHLEEGDLFLLSPSVPHGIEVMDDESVVINILIRHSTFMDIFLNTIRDKSQIALFFLGGMYDKNKIPYILFHTGLDTQIRDSVLEIVEEQEEADEYSDKITCAMVTIFFERLNRRFGSKVVSGGDVRLVTEYGQRMIDYIIRNYRTVSLTELAEEMHFSVPYCSKLVREMTGTTFQELVTEIRLQQGENLLSHTQLSVAEIGDQIGYKNPETFIRAFQRVYHVSPSQYRRQ